MNREQRVFERLMKWRILDCIQKYLNFADIIAILREDSEAL